MSLVQRWRTAGLTSLVHDDDPAGGLTPTPSRPFKHGGGQLRERTEVWYRQRTLDVPAVTRKRVPVIEKGREEAERADEHKREGKRDDAGFQVASRR